MTVAQLGNLSFRISPSQVNFTYSVDTNVTQTVGGRVVQILGVSMGDLVIQGLYGVDRENGLESWDLAAKFQQSIANLVEAQSAIPTMAQLAGTDNTPMHPTVRFFYDDTSDAQANNLPMHKWDFQVYVKNFTDIDEQGYTVAHKTGKYSYGYQLTLFIVEDNTGQLATVAKNDFLARLSEGVGWKQSDFNGPMGVDQLKTWLATNSPDGTIHGLVLQEFTAAGSAPANGVPTPGVK